MSEVKLRTQCAMCLREGPLCDSHVIPEFIYKPLYSAKRRMVGLLTTENGVTRKYLQKELREELLCGDCEDHINTRYEQPSVPSWRTLTSVNHRSHPTMR